MLDTHGKKLIQMCKTTKLLIANGRLDEDMNIGEYTFTNNNGSSTVDYLLLDSNDFTLIKTFQNTGTH